MYDRGNRSLKVIKFYQSLPSDLLDDVFENLPANREFRRKLSKIKSLDDKVKNCLSSSIRSIFVDSAYNSIKHLVELDIHSADYNKIISSFTNDNKQYLAIFFFRWCYEKNEEGTSYNDIYFDTFVDSELFDCIIDGEDIDPNRNNTVKDKKESSKIENKPDLDKTALSAADTFREETVMKLLGHIEKRNTFYNFFPQYGLNDESFIEIPTEKLKTDYPVNGGINLAYTPYSSAAAFLDEIPTDRGDDQYVNNIYVIEMDKNDLAENNNDVYRVKLDLPKFVQDGKKLDSIIKNINNYNIYKVVTGETDYISSKNFIDDNIFLSVSNVSEGENVVLFYGDKYYGPFKVCIRQLDGKYYINPQANRHSYLIPFFTYGDVEEIELEKQAFNSDPKYTNLIRIFRETPNFEDCITDEILLEKISDDISIDLAVENPEEFSRLCSNSPFLAELPQNIIKQRISRLLEIIGRVEDFKEAKHKIFESLLKLYEGEYSQMSNKMIEDSEAYKTVLYNYNEERSKNEEAEKQIQALTKSKNELSERLEKMSIESSGTALSAETEAEYEAKLDQLNAELMQERAITATMADIEALKGQQEDLKRINDWLKDQAKEYEEKIKTSRDEISKAIKEGTSEMAKLAFDPFISNEMMKQAAAWDSQIEDEEYQKLQSQLSDIQSSSLTGMDLVNYIVDYVTKRRDYLRNDIINIYVSIAQNFITVFSGEPGTGKTSMCNIVAETLGLLKYGDRLNRFVTVSVERGWSSKKDLIGYYNPLTRKYDKSNGKIYDALKMVDIERDKSKFPFIIMLDEANLSPIEYYWADFMRLTDRTSENDKYINIGTDRELYVPETLKFVATINTDQTTETLSPRLIDRACIIKLPYKDLKRDVPKDSSPSEIITWESFHDTFSKTSELHPVTDKALKEIYKLFNDYGMCVSPRIQKVIEDYVKAAQVLMVDEAGVLAREKALDFAIVQKLLPKINGYYSQYQRFFETLKQYCKDYHLKMTEEAISKIVDAQDSNMGYCQYLI